MSQAGTSDHDLPEAERLELERRRLECEKLRVEIAQASAPWWTRAGYVGSMVPIVLALVGFFSALATGFFDTERTALQTEITALTQKRDQLTAENESIQRKIDEAYVRLLAASAEARYAISHVTSFASQLDALEAKASAAVEKLSGEDASAVRELVSFSRQSTDVAQITEEELGFFSKSLREIPASAWAVELQPTPRGLYMPGRVLMEASDGRLYDPTDGSYYRPEELAR